MTPTYRRRSLAGIAALVTSAALALAACSSSSTSEAGDDTSPAAKTQAGHTSARTFQDGTGSGAAPGVFPRTVKHYNGETTIDAEPTRVVTISTGQLDAAVTLGVMPVGAASADGSEVIPPYVADAFPDLRTELGTVVDVGNRTNPDIEKVVDLEPDLIVMNAAVLTEDWYQALSKIAPTVVTKGNGVNWKSDFLLLADALGRTDRAQAFLDTFHADADAFREGLGGDAPTVSFLQSTGDRTRIMGIPSLAGGIAEDLGLARPKSQQFDDNSLDISAEKLELADGDWIFYAGKGTGLDVIQGAALWPTLQAVADDRTVEVDLDVFYLNAGPTASRIVLDTLIDTLS